VRGENVTGARADRPWYRYCFLVRGRLGETIRSAFPALQAQASGGDTVLTGPLPDRAALYGVLAQIEALRLELLGAGLGSLFVLIFLVGLFKVNTGDTGVASGLVNVGQQVGGSIGLAVVGTVAWSAVASTRRSATAAAAAQAGTHPSAAQAAALQAEIYHHALATGFSRGYLVSAGVLALAAIIALFMMRLSRQDLSGADRCRPVTPAHRT